MPVNNSRPTPKALVCRSVSGMTAEGRAAQSAWGTSTLNSPVTASSRITSPSSTLASGDVIRLDAVGGELTVLVPQADWAARPTAVMPDALRQTNALGVGRELFTGMRRSALAAEKGALSWL